MTKHAVFADKRQSSATALCTHPARQSERSRAKSHMHLDHVKCGGIAEYEQQTVNVAART
jgi:hypothetical protein